MKKILLGVALTLLLGLIAATLVMRFGLVPVRADGTHSSLEARIMPFVLHTAVARQASGQSNGLPVSEDDLQSAIHSFKAQCVTCHGTLNGKPSAYGQAFYPAAPSLSGGLPQYKDTEVFWIIKHGIRNTGMPAWGGMLTDQEIWQLVAVLKKSAGEK